MPNSFMVLPISSVAAPTSKKYVFEVFNKTGDSSLVELVLRTLISNQAA